MARKSKRTITTHLSKTSIEITSFAQGFQTQRVVYPIFRKWQGAGNGNHHKYNKQEEDWDLPLMYPRLDLNECAETTNAWITAWIPFVEKNIVAMNIISSSPPLLFVTISMIVVSRKLKAETGSIFSKSSITSCWKSVWDERDQCEQENWCRKEGHQEVEGYWGALVTSTPLLKPW